MGEKVSPYIQAETLVVQLMSIVSIFSPSPTLESLALSPPPPHRHWGLLAGPLKPSWLQAAQAQLPKPLLTGPVLQPHHLFPYHLSNVFLVLGAPSWAQDSDRV